MADEKQYPKPLDLFRNYDGGLCNRQAKNKDEETNLRSQGYKTAKELWG